MTNEEGAGTGAKESECGGGKGGSSADAAASSSSGSPTPDPGRTTVVEAAFSGSPAVVVVVPDGGRPLSSSSCDKAGTPEDTGITTMTTTTTTTTTPKGPMPPGGDGTTDLDGANDPPPPTRQPEQQPQTRPSHPPGMRLSHQRSAPSALGTTTVTMTSTPQSQSRTPAAVGAPLVNFNSPSGPGPGGGGNSDGVNPLVVPQFGLPSSSSSVPVQQPHQPGPGPGPLVLQYQHRQQHYGFDSGSNAMHYPHQQVQTNDATRQQHHHLQLNQSLNLSPSSVESSSLVQYEQKFRDMTELRRGKWTPDEENYSYELIRQFANGTAPDCGNGVTLRSYLAKKLNCAPMRVSKKFAGQNIGKSAFVYRGTSAVRSAAAASLVPPLSTSLAPDDRNGEDDEERNSEEGRKLRYLELRFYASIFQPSPFGDGGGGGGTMTGLKKLFPELMTTQHGTLSNSFPPVLGGASILGQSTSTSILHPNEGSNALFTCSSGNVGHYNCAQHGQIHNTGGGAVLFPKSSVALPRQGAFVSDQHTYIIGNNDTSTSDSEHRANRTCAAGSKHALDSGDTSKSNCRVWPSEPSSIPRYMNLCQDQTSSTTESHTGVAPHKSLAIIGGGENIYDGSTWALRRHSSDPQLPKGASCHDDNATAAAACHRNAVFGPTLPPSLPPVVGTAKENEKASTNATLTVSVDDYGLFAEQSVDAVSQHSAYCDGKGGDVRSLRGQALPYG